MMKRSVLANMRHVGLSCVLLTAVPMQKVYADPAETVAASRMELRTKNPRLEPGIFGDYWWANRFLSRHRLVEANNGKTVDFVMVGDSIMHFWELKHPASWGKFSSGRSVLNLGYAGDKTENLIWRIEHGELDGYEAKVVILMIGTNNNTKPTTDPANVAAGIEKAVSLIRKKQPKAKVVLHPIFPRGAAADSEMHASARARNERTNGILEAFAKANPDIQWVDFNARFLDASGWVPKSLMDDQIHPTDAGYDIWMKALADHDVWDAK